MKINFMKENWRKLFLIIYAFFLPIVSFAQTNPIQPIAGTNPTDPNAQGKIINPIPRVTDVPGLIHTILTGALTVGIPVVALAIIYCGFLFVAARGNSEKLTKAKDALLWTLVGAAVLLGAWAIASMISATVTGLGS
jgi:hypothetical protein